MVLSIKHWCLVAGLIEPTVLSSNPRSSYVLTELGRSVFLENGFDPYLEDPATLWLLHWKIASNTEDCTTWFWLFNLWHTVDFTKEQILREMINWLEQQNFKAISSNSLKRDVECCLRTYVHSRQKSESIVEDTLDCPLAELNLIAEVEDSRTYRFTRDGQNSLPDEIFLFALSDFWLKHNGNGNTLSLQRITYDPGSPGKTFKLDEESLVRRLEEIKKTSKKAFSYDETSGIKQIYRHQKIEPIEWLKHYETVKFFRTQNSRCSSFYFLTLNVFQTALGFCSLNPNAV